MNAKPNRDQPFRGGLIPSEVVVRLHFAGREKEIAILKSLYSQRKHVLIVGSPGIGKSALLDQLKLRLPLFLSKDSSNLSRMCHNLEDDFRWPHSRFNLIKRQNRLLAYLQKRNQPVVFDHLRQTSTTIARFLSRMMKRIPVWIICRSERSHDIGSIWRFLSIFVHLQVQPLKKTDFRVLIAQAVARGIVPSDALSYVSPLYRISQGNPRLLETVLSTLASRDYKTGMSFGQYLRALNQRDLEIETDLNQREI